MGTEVTATRILDAAPHHIDQLNKEALQQLMETWRKKLVEEAKFQFTDFSLAAGTDESNARLIGYLKEIHAQVFAIIGEYFPKKNEATREIFENTFKKAAQEFKIQMMAYFIDMSNWEEIKALAEKNQQRVATMEKASEPTPELAIQPQKRSVSDGTLNVIQQSETDGIPQWMAEADNK